VLSHDGADLAALQTSSEIGDAAQLEFELVKEFGQTAVAGLGPLDQPTWHWPKR
jgi:hypothetical protein